MTESRDFSGEPLRADSAVRSGLSDLVRISEDLGLYDDVPSECSDGMTDVRTYWVASGFTDGTRR